jgi:hypothetical protein
VEEAAHGVLSYESIGLLAPASLAALQSLVAPNAWPDVASAFWNAWESAGRPRAGAWFVDPQSSSAPAFWPHVPVEVLLVLLGDSRPKRLPYALFTDAHWAAWASIAAVPTEASDADAWRHVPRHVAETLLERGVSSSSLASNALWSRFGDVLASCAMREFETGHAERALATLEAAPDARSEELLELLRARLRPLDLPPEALERLRRWLYTRVSRRSPGFARAYRMLSEIETKLTELQRLAHG